MKKFALVLLVMGLVALGALLGRPLYRAQKEQRFAIQAREALLKGEGRSALLNAQEALLLNSNNLVACRVMADLADNGRSPMALTWRRKVLDLEPTLENRLVFASCALRYEQAPFPLASQALAEAAKEETAARQVSFHVVSAQFALRQNRFADAMASFSQAMTLEPTNQLHRMNLAMVQLQHGDAAASEQARVQLESLSAREPWTVPALRALFLQQLLQKNFTGAERLSLRLLQSTNSGFSDRLEHLVLLRRGESQQFRPFLEQLQRQAGTNSVQAAELVTRLNQLGLAAEAVDWTGKISAEVRQEWPVPMALSEGYAAQGKWRELEQFLSGQQWKDREFLRRALLALAVRRQEIKEVAESHWRDATQLAAARSESTAMLAQLAASWGWTNEVEAVLWGALHQFPKERWPVDSLNNRYVFSRNTRRLYELLSVQKERDPANAEILNNWAALGMLLQTNLDQAHLVAREVFEKDRGSFAFLSTYAWSLHLQGKSAEALALLQTLKTAELEDPSLAAYYGTLLAVNGQPEKAKPYFDRAEKASILPEERQMVLDARRRWPAVGQ